MNGIYVNRNLPGVRQIIPKLRFNELEQSDIIPFGVFDSVTVPKRKFPTVVFNTEDGFAKFGHFVEAYMRSIIDYSNEVNHSDPRLKCYKELLIDEKYESLWNNIKEYVIKDFTPFERVLFDVEFKGDNVAGHPDIVIRYNNGSSVLTNIIIDVKTTMNFSKMREETVLQLLSYAALARNNGHDVKTIGVALPWQQLTIYYDIEFWDHQNFLFMLNDEARVMVEHINDLNAQLNAAKKFEAEQAEQAEHTVEHTDKFMSSINVFPEMETVGSHTHLLDTLYNTFSKFYGLSEIKTGDLFFGPQAACQIFLAGNQQAVKKKFADDDILRTAKLINKKGLRTYIHAPYSINLSRPYNEGPVNNKEKESWAVGLLRYQLETGSSYGARGVVVHVGKPGTSNPVKNPPLTVNEAKDNMREFIRKCLDVCSPQCQLLIETPAGQGTELYTDINELWEFWNDFTDSERSRLGICIDTCHVFAAGHDPVEYLTFWLDHDSAAISLIHLNDSKHERGSRKDRHAPPGQGYIGSEALWKIVNLANSYGIPMVME